MAIEDATINGLDVTVAGRSSSGSARHHEHSGLRLGAEAWDAAGKTGPEILTDVLAMRGVLATDKYYGPYTLYIPTAYGITLNRPFEATGNTGLSIQAYLEMCHLRQRQAHGQGCRSAADEPHDHDPEHQQRRRT